MQVSDVMTRDPLACGPESTLTEVTRLMWRGDCGFVPVVDHWGRVLDVITDRDICLATTMRDRAPSLLLASDLVRGTAVVTCRPDDDVRKALALLVEHRVRRIPVTDGNGTLRGVLSVDDLLGAASDLEPGVGVLDLLAALRSIFGRQVPSSLRARSATA